MQVLTTSLQHSPPPPSPAFSGWPSPTAPSPFSSAPSLRPSLHTTPYTASGTADQSVPCTSKHYSLVSPSSGRTRAWSRSYRLVESAYLPGSSGRSTSTFLLPLPGGSCRSPKPPPTGAEHVRQALHHSAPRPCPDPKTTPPTWRPLRHRS